jgi:hypothetical protein
MTSAWRSRGSVIIIERATARAYTNPVQTASTSNAAQLPIRRLACTMRAVAGIGLSGVEVATMIRSIGCGV